MFQLMSSQHWLYNGAIFAEHQGATAQKVESHIEKRIRGASADALACLRRMLVHSTVERWTAQRLLREDAFLRAHAVPLSTRRIEAARQAQAAHSDVQPAVHDQPRAIESAARHRQAANAVGKAALTGAMHRPPPVW